MSKRLIYCYQCVGGYVRQVLFIQLISRMGFRGTILRWGQLILWCYIFFFIYQLGIFFFFCGYMITYDFNDNLFGEGYFFFYRQKENRRFREVIRVGEGQGQVWFWGGLGVVFCFGRVRVGVLRRDDREDILRGVRITVLVFYFFLNQGGRREEWKGDRFLFEIRKFCV